ncbi:hypothetical protein MCOR02_002810 [Pyricularia oryzae]|uniref:Uncharacterized protein n=1 Tax=Pyricularia oryzae TaxID=318829 RepID=A0A4P7N9N8_PYROR|nr:hypothetical protein MCOR02_002810 [Pyricularia oryzae]QBZ56860.1 hypothetical protein PoMZ_01778 [Pyricularia oryzae]
MSSEPPTACLASHATHSSTRILNFFHLLAVARFDKIHYAIGLLKISPERNGNSREYDLSWVNCLSIVSSQRSPAVAEIYTERRDDLTVE